MTAIDVGSVSVTDSGDISGTGWSHDRLNAKIETMEAYWDGVGLVQSTEDKVRFFRIWAAELEAMTEVDGPIIDAAIAAGGGGGGGGTVITDGTLTGDGSSGSHLGVDTSVIATRTYAASQASSAQSAAESYADAGDATNAAAISALTTTVAGKVSNVSGTAPIASSGGTTPAISLNDDGVTFAKMQNIGTDKLVGRDTAGTGDPEEIAVTGGLEFSGSQQIRIADGGVTAAKLSGNARGLIYGIARGMHA